MWIALLVVSILMVGGWALAGYLINKYKSWSARGRWLDEKRAQW